LPVVADTLVTANRNAVTERAANVTIVADPSLFNDGTDTDDPSENVNIPPVT
jgi:hypothetical protein